MKKTIPLATIIILLGGLFGLFLYQSYQDDKAVIESRQLASLSNLYQSALTTYRLNAHAVFDNIIMRPEVLSVLHRLDPDSDESVNETHQALLTLLDGRYQNLRRKLHLRQLHFHLPDGRSLLRMHRPDKYGDPLFDVRHSVKLANTSLIYVEGFEEGRIFNGYRYVFPIVDQQRHLGSVEISVSISAIIDHLSQIYKQHSFYFILNKSLIAKKVFEDERSNYRHSKLSPDFVIDEEVHASFNSVFEVCLDRLSTNPDVHAYLTGFRPFVRSSRIDKRDVVVTFLPIYNVKNEAVAYIAGFEENPIVQDLEDALIIRFVLVLLLLTIFYGSLNFIMNRHDKALNEKEKLDQLVEEKTAELEEVQAQSLQRYRSTILALINLTEERDTYTAGHTRRVAEYARMLAQEMGFDEDRVTKLYEAAILHDIGKIVTPDSVLLKPGKLTPREYNVIKEHVIVGESILFNIEFDDEIVDIVKYHHERCDGSGYPYGLTCDEIPIMARILAVADTFDAMTTNRIYKPRKTVEVSLKELQSLSGTLYDPEVVDRACRVFRDISIDLTVTQLPTSVIEQERLSHYFKDPLTDLFNIRYLQLMMQFGIEERYYICANIIAIRNFTDLNREQGWETGNKVLVQFAEMLEQWFDKSLNFRIYGDDFVVLSETHMDIDIEDLQKKFEKVSNFNLTFELMHYDLHNQDQRHSLIEKMQNEIG